MLREAENDLSAIADCCSENVVVLILLLLLVGEKCDPRGSLSPTPDRNTGRCRCKVSVFNLMFLYFTERKCLVVGFLYNAKSIISNNMKLVHWPFFGWAVTFSRKEGTGWGRSPSIPVPFLLYQI